MCIQTNTVTTSLIDSTVKCRQTNCCFIFVVGRFLSKGMLSHSGSEASTSEDSIADGPTVEQKR